VPQIINHKCLLFKTDLGGMEVEPKHWVCRRQITFLQTPRSIRFIPVERNQHIQRLRITPGPTANVAVRALRSLPFCDKNQMRPFSLKLVRLLNDPYFKTGYFI